MELCCGEGLGGGFVGVGWVGGVRYDFGWFNGVGEGFVLGVSCVLDVFFVCSCVWMDGLVVIFLMFCLVFV